MTFTFFLRLAQLVLTKDSYPLFSVRVTIGLKPTLTSRATIERDPRSAHFYQKFVLSNISV